jgi:hypothetical protein
MKQNKRRRKRRFLSFSLTKKKVNQLRKNGREFACINITINFHKHAFTQAPQGTYRHTRAHTHILTHTHTHTHTHTLARNANTQLNYKRWVSSPSFKLKKKQKILPQQQQKPQQLFSTTIRWRSLLCDHSRESWHFFTTFSLPS